MKFFNSDALVDLLFEQGVVTAEQREQIIAQKSSQRQKILRAFPREERGKNRLDMVDIIVSMQLESVMGKLLDAELIVQTVAKASKLEYRKLDPLKLDMDLVTKIIPYNFAMRHLIVPIERSGERIRVAVYHPDCKTILRDIEQANQLSLSPCLATKEDIISVLSEFFGFQRSISAAESQCSREGDSLTLDLGNLEQYVQLSSTKELTSSDQHIKTAVSHIFQYALDQRASDIHIEPKREKTVVRFRIDGALHTIYKLPKAVHAALVSRLKFLARLDIAEKRRPQDGRIKLGAKNEQEVEVRFSTVPVSFGEKVVMRILDPSVMFQDISELGFSDRDLTVYRSCISAPHGIILVTGPTGSGKSTTLYSTLKAIASSEKNIITVEDPVEMVHEEFNQIAVQPAVDVTFSTILRNILRQDPDIIMIGEIRDRETAAHAVQAAMTGHLVFSTLHTNTALGAIDRLEDLGLEPFMIASTLLGCMAQRLVKTICSDCVEEYEMPASELRQLGFPAKGEGVVRLKRGAGCRACRGTGYRGRCGIFEIFPVTRELKKGIGDGLAQSTLEELAIRGGMSSLRQDAWQKVQAGITTCEEVVRVTSDDLHTFASS